MSGAMNASAEDIDYDSCATTTAIYLDADLDGYGSGEAIMACNMPDGYVDNGEDCDDSNADVYPGADEVCDGIDNDCDAANNEGLATSTLYRDFDGDGYGDASTTMEWCSADYAGYVVNDTDCDDRDADVNPSEADDCDGFDNNCNGEIDEDCPAANSTYYADVDGDGFGDSASSTEATSRPAGFVSDSSDCNDNNYDINPDATEICDGIDNDCDGETDENVTGTWYLDADDDGWGDSPEATTTCDALSNYVAEDGDCDDNNDEVYPGATEVCDGRDNDCDDSIDEGLLTRYYLDADDDGYGLSDYYVDECERPGNYAEENGDCNDDDDKVYPGAHEYCDGRDNDCDGGTDENCNDNDDDGDDSDDGDDNGCPCDCIRDCINNCLNDCGCNNDDDDDNDDDDNNWSVDCAGPFKNHGQYVSCMSHKFDAIRSRLREKAQELKNKGEFMRQVAHDKAKEIRAKAKGQKK